MSAAATPRTGRVTAVCLARRAKGGIPKEETPSAQVTRWGIPGDVHYGPTRWYAKLGKEVENDRPITVVGVEAVRAACAQLGIPTLAPGQMGENLLVEGLGDLSDLVGGDLLSAGGVVLEVREQNEPCRNLCVHHPEMLKAMVGRRGVICVVRREGEVRRGDDVTLERPAQRERAATPADLRNRTS